MQGNARGTYESGGKVPGERRGMPGKRMGVGAKCQGNAGECHSNVWEWCSARGMQEMLGNARGTRMGVGAKCQGNVGECKGMPGNIWEWVQSARGMQVNATATYGSGAVPGNAGECQGNVWEWAQSARGM